ncbi:P-II family nitrogen regulator [Clostridium manihotivorum]|uniref:P-II family nitrogen regulator n=1 Tax=Clostridium manihotivorum TaxID=2320868 RepID=A0A410DRB1_9CLOT|nr:P-II family nitrogen regulator [Clostridium manihotivorum]QAA31601.1 P-II family nitrogen regulator [Clostridium manihotivorum]
MGEKLSKIDIIVSPSRFDELKDALSAIGITGMTVSNVLGCGMQKGHKEYYRGLAVEMNLLPKIKLEIVVCDVPVQLVVDTAKKILHTGNIGDGKIFVYDVQNVIRISTGEEGRDALQYTKE